MHRIRRIEERSHPRHLMPGLFLAIALSLVVFGTMVAVAIRAGAWRSHGPITQHGVRADQPRTVPITG